MDQPGRNKEFVKNNLIPVFNGLKLTNQLINILLTDENNPFFDLMPLLEQLTDENTKKMFILMQFTKERHPTEYLANVLRDLGEISLADKIIQYNRSEEFFNYDDKNALTVRKAIIKNSATSMCYTMDATPRGICLIIVNEIQLEREAQAFEYVFKQMYFKVKVIEMQSIQRIRQILKKVADNQKYKDMNALVTVAIGHGLNECFLGQGYDYNPDDRVPIVDLVNIFSDTNCLIFKDKPKIHLFNCCRIRTASVDENVKAAQQIDLAQCFNPGWQSTNAHTTVIYSCSEGFKSFFDPKLGFSYFGRAFIFTLAQFAHEYHLDQLILKVNKRLDEENLKEQKPQVIKHYCILNLFFNPGL